jgi:hypothetical protein
MTITIRPRWSLGRGKTLVPSRWQATDAVGGLVLQLDNLHVAAGPLTPSVAMGFARARHHVTFPVPRHGPVLDFGGPFADWQRVDDLPTAFRRGR